MTKIRIEKEDGKVVEVEVENYAVLGLRKDGGMVHHVRNVNIGDVEEVVISSTMLAAMINLAREELVEALKISLENAGIEIDLDDVLDAVEMVARAKKQSYEKGKAK